MPPFHREVTRAQRGEHLPRSHSGGGSARAPAGSAACRARTVPRAGSSCYHPVTQGQLPAETPGEICVPPPSSASSALSLADEGRRVPSRSPRVTGVATAQPGESWSSQTSTRRGREPGAGRGLLRGSRRGAPGKCLRAQGEWRWLRGHSVGGVDVGGGREETAEEGRAGRPGSAGGRRRGRGTGLGSGLGRVRGLPPTLTSAEFSPSSALRTDW